MFQVDLSSNGELELFLDGARRRSVIIPATVGGLEYVKSIIKDHHNGVKRLNGGYIGTLPTQHTVDKHFADEFLKNKAEKAAAAASTAFKDKAEKLGVDLDALSFKL